MRRPTSTSALLAALAAAALVAALPAAQASATTTDSGAAARSAPYQNPRLPVPARVADLVGRMTVTEKIGQLTQAERGPISADPAQISTLALGSVLSGGGSTPTPNTPAAWADMIDGFQRQALSTRLHIPLLYGIDSVHGDGNLVGATIFPHDIGLGATRDPALVEQVEHITAAETRATGPQWVFSPCLCVARDDRWGRTYESFGEDPALVSRLETAITGFQGNGSTDLARPDRVLATAKHFVGDGDTTPGTSTNPGYVLDQGVTQTSRAHLAQVDLPPYVDAVRRHDIGSIMPSFSSVDWTEDGLGNPIKMTADGDLLTGLLKNRIGFDGFLISDWEAIHQLPGDWPTQVRTAVNAGIDMAMEPNAYASFETTLLAEVSAGRVPMSRIDDAVRRILTKKFELGLFEHPFTDRAGIPDIGSPAHRAVARRAAAESQVLLKNSGDVLPLRGTERIYLAGSNADDLGNQAGGWTVTWQGQSGPAIPGTTILAGIRQDAPNATVTFSADASAPTAGNDVGIVVVGETPYAEGMGDVGNNGHTLTLSPADHAAVDRVCSSVPKCVVLTVSGRPLVLTDQLPEIDSLVASWLPGSEGEGVADVLFGHRPFTGTLPQSWPRTADQEPLNINTPNYHPLYPYAFGLHPTPNR